MENMHSSDIGDLHEIIDRKITSIMREMESAGYNARDIALAIGDVVKARWLDRMDALSEARNAMPGNFISDGNEG